MNTNEFDQSTQINSIIRIKSGNLGHQVNSDMHLQTVEIQMRRLIKIFTVCLVSLFCIPIIKIYNKQCR